MIQGGFDREGRAVTIWAVKGLGGVRTSLLVFLAAATTPTKNIIQCHLVKTLLVPFIIPLRDLLVVDNGMVNHRGLLPRIPILCRGGDVDGLGNEPCQVAIDWAFGDLVHDVKTFDGFGADQGTENGGAGAVMGFNLFVLQGLF